MRTLRIAGISLLALVAVLLLLSAWLLRTESGSRALLSMARGWLPPGMTVSQVGGAIAGTLRLQGFRYRDEAIGFDLIVDSAEIEWSPRTLLAHRISVQRARLDGVRLELFAGKPALPPPPESTRDLWQAPIDLSLNDIDLSRVEFRHDAATPVVVRRARVSGSWIGARIEATQLVVDAEDGHLELTARLAGRAPRIEQLQGRFRWHAGGHAWEGGLQASGGRDALQLDADVSSPVSMRANAQLRTEFHGGTLESWHARISVPRFRPYPLLDTNAFETLALALTADGTAGDVRLAGELSLDGERVLIDQLAAAYRQDLLEIAALRLRLNSQPGVLSGNARLKLDAPRSVSARLEWDEIELPQAWAGAQFRFAGRAALTAMPERFAANGSAYLARATRDATLTFRVDGSRDALRVEQFELTQVPGQLTMQGRMDFGDAPRWDLRAHGKAFDPSLFIAAWPGALDFDLDSAGEWSERTPQAVVRLPRLAGKLRGRPVSGHADLIIGKDLQPRGTAHLKSGSAVVDASAATGASPRVETTLRVGALEEWHPELRGAIQARLTSRGRWPEVDVDAHAEATGLGRGDTSLQSAALQLTGHHGRSRRGRAALTARGVTLGGFEFDALKAVLDGDEKSHRLELDARGAALGAVVRAHGTLDRRTWSGLLDQLTLEIASVPPLALAQPARAAYAPGALSLDTACLQGGDIRICAGLRGHERDFVANYRLEALPLQLVTTLAAPRSKLAVQGLLEGSGEIRRTANGTFGGHAFLLSPAGSLAQDSSEHAQRLGYRDFRLDADLSGGGGRASVHAELVDQGELTGSLLIGTGQEDPSLAGKASAGLRDLGPLTWWLPQLAQLRGSAQVDAEVGGTMSAPRVALTLRGAGLDAEVPLLGLHLREGNVTATLEPGGGFDARGSIRSGDGEITLSGARDPAAGIRLDIRGGNFLAASVPGARITIAPDLALTGRPGNLLLNGSVTLEEADVHLEKLSINKTYRASPDVVIVDREQTETHRSLGLTTDVRIVLGSKVTLNGFGLESTVGGELRVIEKENEVSRATGEVRVAGTYEAFGRKLNIERGRLQYAGTALDDPQLDILAVRKIDDITAKLRVTGTARQPRLDVFTDPAMSQTDAMSYLLTGQSAGDLHGQDGAVVSSAAQSVGSLLGNRLAKKFGGKMGLVDEIGVEQNDDLGGSAFTVGKYLSPKLFVSYGVGLFEPGTAVTVRYEFTRHWSLEANDTPEDQHAGVRYRIEK